MKVNQEHLNRDPILVDALLFVIIGVFILDSAQIALLYRLYYKNVKK